MALPFGEDGHQHIGAGDILAAGGLDVNDRALDDALETGRGLGVFAVVHHKRAELIVHIAGEGPPQGTEVDFAGAHHGGGFFVVDQRQEQVLQRRIFVLSLIGVSDGAMQGFFELARKRGQSGASQSFSMVH